ncbi:hypothetical protein ACFYO2_18275 [Streptomyces sp. NPDC006602]
MSTLEPETDEQPRYQPAPNVGKPAVWVLLFVPAAIVVVLGGVYLV